MPGIKCYSCERYSHIGCEFEFTQYYRYKDCVLGKRSQWKRKQEKAEGNEVKAAEMPAEVSSG